MKTPDTLEEALKQLHDVTVDNKGYRIQMDRLVAENNALKDSVQSYEALADEAAEFDVVAPTIERIEMDRTAVEGEFQLGVISGQARDVFMGHTTLYLKMLHG